jgi:predicted nuclease with TOPRIM domain
MAELSEQQFRVTQTQVQEVEKEKKNLDEKAAKGESDIDRLEKKIVLLNMKISAQNSEITRHKTESIAEEAR